MGSNVRRVSIKRKDGTGMVCRTGIIGKGGELEMTKNLAERAVKPFVIGRKNWLLSDTEKDADASAKCYSIIESANLDDNLVCSIVTKLKKTNSYCFFDFVT